MQATAMGRGGEVFVLEMGKPVKIIDLARSLVELSGLRFLEDVQVTFTGVRPGEKLSEKLFFDHEKSVATRSKQIHVARLENGHQIDIDAILKGLQLLVRGATDEKELGLRFMAMVESLDSPEAVPAMAPVMASAMAPAPAMRAQVVALEPLALKG